MFRGGLSFATLPYHMANHMVFTPAHSFTTTFTHPPSAILSAMHKKDFNKWHKKKAKIDDVEKRAFFHVREVWFVHLGVNVGFEQDGGGEDFLRPVVIVRKFNNEVFWGIPLTKNHKEGRFYFSFPMNNEMSTAILSQIRLIDARRLSYKIGDISEKEYEALTEKLKTLLP